MTDAYFEALDDALPGGLDTDLLDALYGDGANENSESSHLSVDPEHPLVAGRRHPHHLSGAAAARPKTIGAFSTMITDQLEQVPDKIGPALFSGHPRRQISREHQHPGGGGPIEVDRLGSAKRPLTEIADPGEGEMRSVYDEDGDLGHYVPLRHVKHDRAYLPYPGHAGHTAASTFESDASVNPNQEMPL